MSSDSDSDSDSDSESSEGDPVAAEASIQSVGLPPVLDEGADDGGDEVMVITCVAAIVLFVITLVCIKQVYDRFYKLSAIKLRQEELQAEEANDIKRAEGKD